VSGLDGLQLDADGYLDMDQFPDDGTDLADADLAGLRDALHSDPVEEPTDQQWDAMFDDVVSTGDTGPFALDDVEGLNGDLEYEADGSAAPDADDVLDDGDLPDADDGADDLDLPPDDLGLDDGGADDLDLDIPVDDGLDLTPDAVDDAFSADGFDDAPADIANNDFEDLL
jgi:hypothetical protein